MLIAQIKHFKIKEPNLKETISEGQQKCNLPSY